MEKEIKIVHVYQDTESKRIVILPDLDECCQTPTQVSSLARTILLNTKNNVVVCMSSDCEDVEKTIKKLQEDETINIVLLNDKGTPADVPE